MENMLNSRENGKMLSSYTENTLYCSDVYNLAQQLVIPFKLSRLLVTHDGGKLSLVGRLSLAECLEGRQGTRLLE